MPGDHGSILGETLGDGFDVLFTALTQAEQNLKPAGIGQRAQQLKR